MRAFTASVLLAALSTHSARAFFRMGCSSPVVVERIDPLVSPGKVSGHLHQVLGGNGINFTQTYEDARASSCSTCQARADLSNYWTPTLFYQAQNGTFQSVNQVGGGTVYYLQRYNANNNTLIAFPEGFRMIAGDPMLRSFNASSLEQQAVSFVCLDYNGSGAGGQWNYLPTHNCPDGVRLQVFFPSCWDGQNVDSADHKSHVAYPDGVDHGNCPSTHPVRLVSIFYEIIYDTNAFADQWYGSSQPFVLSNGDPTGYGHHGDFLNGWDVPTLQNAIDQCTDDSGVINDCSVLDLRSNDEMNNCILPPSVPEQITGTMSALPGCNPVQSGPANATPPSSCDAPTQIVSGSFLKPVPGWTALGCANDGGSQRALPSRWAPGNMTVENCLTYCSANNYTYAGLEWSQECWCGSTFDNSLIGNYSCAMLCQGDESEYCGGSLTLAMYQLGGSDPAQSSSAAPPPPPPATPTPTPTPSPSSSSTESTPSLSSTDSSTSIPTPTPTDGAPATVTVTVTVTAECTPTGAPQRRSNHSAKSRRFQNTF